MPTYRLTLEYEGTRYSGWQEQKNARTVMGELRRAIEETVGEIRELGGAGRTDAGVHALAQVAHLKLARPVEIDEFCWAVNDRLPSDIHMVSCVLAADRFHSRHHAASRVYLFQIATRRTALAKRFVWWVKHPLDRKAMARAAALLAGSHDFRLFCERPDDQPSTQVLVHRAEIVPAGSLILFRIEASHFVWKMVRRVVGTLVKVGTGELSERDFKALLAAKPIPGAANTAAWTAPPSGLFLERVTYEGEPDLAPLAPAIPVP